MSELVRCTACRGSKRVIALGGVMGDCKTCDASGKIKLIDKVVKIQDVTEITVNEMVEAVAVVSERVDDVVVPKKRAIYQRKKG